MVGVYILVIPLVGNCYLKNNNHTNYSCILK